MASKSVAGEYTSQAIFNVSETGANTLTFEKLETGLSVYDKIGWVVQRLEFTPSEALASFMNSSGDAQIAALTMTNSMANLSIENPAILARHEFIRWDFGTAAAGALYSLPFVYDYSTMSGGGILVLPSPLYLGVVGSGLTAASTISLKMFFKAIELSDQDYFNLVQARQLLIST